MVNMAYTFETQRIIKIYVTGENQENKSLKNKTPKCVISFFLMSQIFFGQNFGFASILKKSLRRFVITAQYISTLICATCIMSASFVLSKDIWTQMVVSDFILFTIIFYVYCKKYTVCNMMSDIHSIYDVTRTDTWIMYLILIGFFGTPAVVKVGTLYIRCDKEVSYCQKFDKTVGYLILVNQVIYRDLISTARVFVNFYLYAAIKRLRHDLMTTEITLMTFSKRFDDIADIYDNIRPFVDGITTVELLFKVPDFVNTLWWMLKHIKSQEKVMTYVSEIIFASHSATAIIIPAILAELIKSQVDGIMMVLHENLKVEYDEKRSAELVRNIRYMKVRRLDYPAYRFIPLDLRLLVSLAGLCTTYFIVLVQFTHIVD